MPVPIGVKRLLDLPQWRPLAPAIASWTAAGSQMVGDMRNGPTRHPYFYSLQSTSTLYAYNPALDSWIQVGNPGISVLGGGASAVFHPTQGPRGVLAAGNTTSSVVLSTALPAAVGVDQLANRGDGVGFTIRIIGNASSGSSGLVAEAVISGNTGGTTPTLTLSASLTWTPQTGDAYEILSGRVFLMGSGTALAGIWKYYDIATNSMSGNLGVTNLPTNGTDGNLITLSEGHVPYNLQSGQGFYGVIDASATAAGSITGQASGGDAGAALNQWRNFQIRIVSDTVNPTAVGQRRRISGNTAGPSAVYSLYSNWTVTPSTSAFYVVENDDDKILYSFGSGNSGVYNYNIQANTWDTGTWAFSTGANPSIGMITAQAFGIVPNVSMGVLNSQIYRFRGGASSSLDVFDIAAGSIGVWTLGVAYGNALSIITTGASGCYDPWMNQGRYLHIDLNGTSYHARLDLLNRVLEPEAYLRFPVSTALVGGRMACAPVVDGGVNVMSQVYQVLSNQQYLFCLPVIE